MRRSLAAVLLAVGLVGCGDGLSAGTEAILVAPPKHSGTAPIVADPDDQLVPVSDLRSHARADGLAGPRGFSDDHGNVPAGTLVRIVEDSGNGGDDRQVKILILEGACKDLNGTV